MIVVVGSLNLDLVARVARMSRPGETVLALGYAEHAGGKGANQAVAAARAGARVAMVGRVGHDDAGARLREGLDREGVEVTEVRPVDAPTGRALIEVDDDGQNRVVVVPGANRAWGPADLPLEVLDGAALIVLQREMRDDVVAGAIRHARTVGARVLLNLAPAGPVAPEVLRDVDVLVVNESEAAALAGLTEGDVASDPDSAARALAERVRDQVVVTLGANGAVFAGRSGQGHVAGFPVEAVDTTGAGDAFVGALAARSAEGSPIAEAVRFACAAGAEAASRAGAQPSLPTREAIERRAARAG